VREERADAWGLMGGVVGAHTHSYTHFIPPQGKGTRLGDIPNGARGKAGEGEAEKWDRGAPSGRPRRTRAGWSGFFFFPGRDSGAPALPPIPRRHTHPRTSPFEGAGAVACTD
jgi:hypothetical protein